MLILVSQDSQLSLTVSLALLSSKYRFLIQSKCLTVLSEMAELGVVASGIAVASLAARLAEGAVKLKAFTDSVKNAPDEIKGIVSGVETLTLVLSDISSRAEIHADEIGLQSTRSCLSHCQIAVEALTKVAQDLSEGIRRRRRLGSLKAVLRNGEILSLRQRLIDAQMSLVLSRQIYTE